MSAIEKQFWAEDEEGRCMCWKCHNVHKQHLQRESGALTRSSLGRSSVGSDSEAAHVPSREVCVCMCTTADVGGWSSMCGAPGIP